MIKMTHKIMYQKDKGGVWSTYETWSEKDARDTANRLWREGYYRIQMFVKSRIGWSLSKEVKQNERVAKAKQKAYIEYLAEVAGAKISFN